MRLPDPLKGLAAGTVKPMTPSLDPSQMSAEAVLATLWVTVRALDDKLTETRNIVQWILRVAVGCLLSLVGALFMFATRLLLDFVSAYLVHPK